MYKLLLSIRYLYRRPISYLAIVAVALCVFIVIVVMTVMTGLVGDFKDKNHRYVGDCAVGVESLVGFPCYAEFAQELGNADFVKAVSPVISTYGLVGSEYSEQGFGVQIVGLDPVLHSKVTSFAETLYYHKAKADNVFAADKDANRPGCVVGIDLWLRRTSTGEYLYDRDSSRTALAVTCFPLTIKGALAKAGTDIVNTKTFVLTDTSESGLARVDGSVVYLPLEHLQQLCGMNEPVARVSWLYIKFKEGIETDDGRNRVLGLWQEFRESRKDAEYADLLGAVTVQGWKQYRREYIAAMEKEQTMMTIMFGLVGLTTVFIVFVVFYMIISHKTKDIGILKSVGASAADLAATFLLYAFWLGAIGNIIGTILGWTFLANINRIEDLLFNKFGFQLWDRTMYAIGDIPHALDTGLANIVGFCAIAACLLGAALPVCRAARAMPAETLQVNQL